MNPNSDKDPTKWGHYDPNQFAAAKNKERKYTEIYIFKKIKFLFLNIIIFYKIHLEVMKIVLLLGGFGRGMIYFIFRNS